MNKNSGYRSKVSLDGDSVAFSDDENHKLTRFFTFSQDDLERSSSGAILKDKRIDKRIDKR